MFSQARVILFTGRSALGGRGSSLGGRGFALGWRSALRGVCVKGCLHGGEGSAWSGRGLHGGADPTPPPRYSQPTVGTHPTGMHYCIEIKFYYLPKLSIFFYKY